MKAPRTEQPRQEAPFFAMQARYLIAADATAERLVADAVLLLGSGLDILLSSSESLTAGQFGALYLFQQAHAAIEEAQSRMTERS